MARIVFLSDCETRDSHVVRDVGYHHEYEPSIRKEGA
jgi:hypothetical protein